MSRDFSAVALNYLEGAPSGTQFYIGEWDRLRNNPTEGATAFRATAKTYPKTRVEYDAAIAELKRLDSQ